MDALYDKARREKLKELKKLMQELIAGGDEEMTGDDLDSALAEAGETAAEETAEHVAKADVEDADEAPEEEESELERMKREYFKPKAPERRPGTAVMIAASKAPEPKKPMAMKGKKASV